MIGFLIELTLVLPGQVAVVLGHIPLLVVLQPGFALFQPGRLPGVQFVILDAVGNAVLLPLLTAVNLVYPWMVGIVDARARATGVAVSAGSLRDSRADGHQPDYCQK